MLIRAPAGARRFGKLYGRCQAALDYLGGDAVAGIVRVGAAGEDGGDDLAILVDDGTTRVAGPDVDAKAGDGALHRAPVIRVAGDHALRRAGAGWLDVEWPALREAEDGCRIAFFGRGERHRVETEVVYAQDRHVVLVVEEDDLGATGQSRAPGLDPGRGLPGDHVGVGDDEIRGRDPGRALDAVAAGYAPHARRPRARREHLRVARYLFVGDGNVGLGTPDLGQRVQLGDGPHQEIGGHPRVQGLQDAGLLHGRVHSCEGRALEGEYADRPHQHEGEREPERRASEAVQRRRSRAREPVP